MNPARFPLSPAQRGLWVRDRIDPGNPALNIAVRWRIDGRIASTVLEEAFARLIDRHATLRTFFAEDRGEPLQFVEPALSFHIPQIDLASLGEDEALAEAERIAQLEARASFDLSVAPLIRATHLRLSENASIILVTAHHMVCDSSSVAILARELQTICTALHGGHNPELAALPLSYGEYCVRQVTDPALQVAQRGDEEFWLRSLAGLPVLDLACDHRRPPVQTSNGSIVSVVIEPEVMNGLGELSGRSGCSIFMTVLAALLTLLHRYSGQSDLAIGSSVADRKTPELKGVVGPFINGIVLRGDLAGNPTFLELLARVKSMVTESFAHQSTPLDRLVEILKPRRDVSRPALVSVNFEFQNLTLTNEGQPSFKLSEMPACSAGALYDLNFLMLQGADGWRFGCEYNTDLYEAATAEQLLHHFVNLLHAVTADAGGTISSLPMLAEAERQALAGDGIRTATPYPELLTLPALFESQVKRTPEAVAAVCGERAVRYRELDLASNRLAAELRSRGVATGSRVAICLNRSVDLLVALLAVLKSRAVYVPLDPGYPPARLAHIIEDSEPEVIVTTRSVARGFNANKAALLLLDGDAATIGRWPDVPLDTMPSPGDLAYVIYTSGSTGRPKGVQIQHRALTNLLWSMRDAPGLAAGDVLLAVTTLSFDIAALEMFLPLIVGAKLVIAEDGEAGDGTALARLLRRHRVTVMQATPVTWQILLAAGWRGDPPLKMLCGGEELPRALADQLLACGGELWNLYGPTETTIWSSALRVEPGAGSVPIGPPIANTQFYVLDAHRELVPTGVAGELFIGGEGVALGYLNLPDETRERFLPDGFRSIPGARLYRSGDQVRRTRRGHIEFLGRRDQQVKLRGFRIELGEIEANLRHDPRVADCVAIVGPGAGDERAIRAYVVARPLDPPLDSQKSTGLAESLQLGLRQSLPLYMCPASIDLLPVLPRTPNGKLDRSSLPLHRYRPDHAGEPQPPMSDLERRLGKIWSSVLGIPDIARGANFFEAGGHSLLAVRLLAQIESGIGQRLSLATLFRAPTIAGQAELIEQGESRAFDFRQVLKLQPNGTRPPLIAINNTGIYYVLSKHLGLDQPFTSLQLFDPSLPRASLPDTLEEIASGYAQLIRRVQRTGPYALLGWCVAGALAFEVARQLTAAGQEVSRLILFDTLAPGYLRRLRWPRSMLADYSYRSKLIAADWARAKSSKHRLVEFLGNRTTVKKLNRLFVRKEHDDSGDRRGAGGPLTPTQYDQWLLKYLERAAESYEPKPYCGKMTLFRSSAEPMGRFLDPQMGWGEFVPAGVEVVVIDGDHFSIFQEPSVSHMAHRIEAAVDSGLPALV